MGIFSLLAFQNNLCCIIWLEKIPHKYPQQLCHFSKVGDDFSYENKLHQTKNLYEVLVKKLHLLSNTWISFYKLPQILGPIQVHVSS